MNCPQCNQPMRILGRHWVCGEHDAPMFVPVVIQPAGGSGNDWLAEVIEQYPYPLACAYRRLRDDVLAHTDDRDALRQLIRLKDCVETLVKYVTLVVLSARLDRRNPIDALDRQVIEKLVAPSLGTWAQGILQPLVRAASTHADARLAPLVAYTTGKFFAEIQEFTAFRNAVLGHGLVRDPREDRHDLSEWLPRLNRLLVPTGFLAAWELVQTNRRPEGAAADGPDHNPAGPVLRSWMGADAESQIQPARAEPPETLAAALSAASHPGEFLLATGQGRPISLYPFIYLLICPRCADTDRLFVYDGQKRYDNNKQEASMIEHTAGHKCAFAEPGKALAERFDQEMLLEYYRSHRRNFEVLEGKLAEFDFAAYRQRIPHFVGRRPLLEAIGRFVGGEPAAAQAKEDGEAQAEASPVGVFDRGYFLLVAAAGMGKTAVLTHWIDHNNVCPLPIRFFWRRGRDLTTLDFLRHMYHGLLKKHNIEDQDPLQPDNENDYRRKLDSLLKLVSQRYLADGEREVIVVDGLDEAGDGSARRGPWRRFPVSCRRGYTSFCPRARCGSWTRWPASRGCYDTPCRPTRLGTGPMCGSTSRCSCARSWKPGR